MKIFLSHASVVVISGMLLIPGSSQASDRESMDAAMATFRNCLEEKGVDIPAPPSREEMESYREQGQRPPRPQLSQEQREAMKECHELAGLPERPPRHRGPRDQQDEGGENRSAL